MTTVRSYSAIYHSKVTHSVNIMAAELNKYLGKLLALLTLLHHCASWHTEDVLLLHRYLLASKEIPFETYNVKLIVPELLDMDNKALLMASPTRYFVASSNGKEQHENFCAANLRCNSTLYRLVERISVES